MLLRLICGLKLNQVSCDTTNFHNTTVSHNTTKVSCSTQNPIFHNKKVSRNKKKSNDTTNSFFKIIDNLPNLLTFFRKSKKKRTTPVRITPVKNRVYLH